MQISLRGVSVADKLVPAEVTDVEDEIDDVCMNGDGPLGVAPKTKLGTVDAVVRVGDACIGDNIFFVCVKPKLL